jgi:hypothetical protein
MSPKAGFRAVGAARFELATFGPQPSGISCRCVANLVAFLGSEDGRRVNGQMIRTSGVIGDEDDFDRR